MDAAPDERTKPEAMRKGEGSKDGASGATGNAGAALSTANDRFKDLACR